MPRVSSAPEDAYHFKGSFEEGWGKVTAASAIVFQFPPQKEASNNRPAGYQDPPALMIQLEIQRYQDGEGNKTPTPPEEVLLSVQKPDKMTGELSACHPGNFPDDNPDLDPVDAGGELGATGNTLFALQDGYALNDRCKWMKFTQSLQEKGFKPAILKRTFFNDLVGLYAFFKNVTQKGSQAGFDANYFVVDKIAEFPYEKKNAGAGKTAASAGGKAPAAKGETARPAATTKTNGAPATAASAPASGDAEEIAQAIVTETLASSKKGALLKDTKKLRIEALMCVSKYKPALTPEVKKAVQDFLTEDWLVEFGQAVGVLEVQADGQVLIN
jgi:hypothetical protein